MYVCTTTYSTAVSYMLYVPYVPYTVTDYWLYVCTKYWVSKYEYSYIVQGTVSEVGR